MSASGTKQTFLGGQSASALPLDSYVDLLGNSERIMAASKIALIARVIALSFCAPFEQPRLPAGEAYGAYGNRIRVITLDRRLLPTPQTEQ
jgi:hypothetical protein